MRKIINVIILLIITFTIIGCTNTIEKIEKFYLAKDYYSEGGFISVNEKDLEKLDSSNYVLFTYNNYCNLPIPCEEIFESFMDKYEIRFLSIPFEDFKNTSFYNKVKYAPSIIIVKNGKVIAHLDANSDDDLNKYQDVDLFSEWIKKYIYLS